MDLSPFDLLRKLGSGVRPGEGSPPAAVLESQDFAQLLGRVHHLGPSRPVQLGSQVELALSSEQEVEIAHLVDVGEAAGTERLLLLYEGHALGIDVAARVVESADDALRGKVLRSFDGIILSGLEPEEVLALPNPDSFALIRNPQVVDLLARRSRTSDSEEASSGGARPTVTFQ